MKYIAEYRQASLVERLVELIRAEATQSWTVMEVCGGQTHAIVRYGLDHLLPEGIELVHGPGCPVCVTPLETLDRAHAIAALPNVTFCSFGDMLRVPGSRTDLLQLKARGADVRIIYSPLDAVKLAAAQPDREVVLFAIGFETTAPTSALAIQLAQRGGLRNFSALVSHVLVPPAMTAILESPDNRVQGFLGPGHVCTVMGYTEYEAIAKRFQTPIVITGFEPVDLLEGLLCLVRQLESRRAEVENQYRRAVQREGNPRARQLVETVFEACDRAWRGVGTIPRSGLRLRESYAELDAERRFKVERMASSEPAVCISGSVLRGQRKPCECPAFGRECTPETPLGATMVSSEGACAAYYAYRREGQTTLGQAFRA